MYVIVNVGTEKAYQKPRSYSTARYKTAAAAKAQCTRLNTEYAATDASGKKLWMDTQQWRVASYADYSARPVKMVERMNIMTGEKFMEAEDTPYFCSPSSESYWSM